MNMLLQELEKGIVYLNSQGKEVNKIKMNPKVFESFIHSTVEFDKENSTQTVLGVDLEADETVEKYEFIVNKLH